MAQTPSPSRRDALSLAAAVAGGVGLTAWLQQCAAPAKLLSLTPVVEGVLADPGSPAAGAARPEVTVVLFTDYQCPICKVTDPAVQQLLDADPTVRVIFKDWPIFGPASRQAAKAALAGARQGRYLPLHAALMAGAGALDRDRIEDAARAAGVDWMRLMADEEAAGAALDAQLGRHALQAFSLGLQGTPAYLVGPYLIGGGLDRRRLRQAVERARRHGPPRAPA